jgi:hypothetical protein
MTASQLPERGQSYIVADHVLGVLSLPAVSVWTNAPQLVSTAAGGMAAAKPGHHEPAH